MFQGFFCLIINVAGKDAYEYKLENLAVYKKTRKSARWNQTINDRLYLLWLGLVTTMG